MKYPIPAEALAQHVLVLGKTRSGKSSKVRLLVERMLDEQKPVCVIDPKGDWWGLKSTADGQKAGYPVIIFGGDHADVPINEHSGAHIAELIATGNRPCIIDLGGWMVGARTRFFVAFAEALFRLTRGPRWLVIDECHNFAPQGRVLDPDAGKMLHWANRLASEGAGKGLTLISASQRPQKVHKDYVTSHETLIACRAIHPLDRNATKDWIDGCADPQMGRDVLAGLAGLDRSQAFVWSPEIGFGPALVTFPLFKTYDSFKPQPHDAPAALKGWAAVNLDDVKARLAHVVEEAKANNPKALKAEIARLQAELRKAPVAAPSGPTSADLAEIKRVAFLEGVAEGEGRGRHQVLVEFETVRAELPKLVDRHLHDFTARTLEAAGRPAQAARRVAPPAQPREPVTPPTPRPAPRAPASGETTALSGPQSRLINAVAWWRHFGFDAPSRVQVAFVAGYKPNTGTFNTYLGALSSAGLIAYPDRGRVSLTEAGEAQAGDLDERELLVMVKDILSGPQVRLLEAAIDAYPGAITRDDLATAAGYSPGTGTFNTYLGSLSTLDLVSYPARGQVRAADWLFP